jgi:RNA polymerase sigma-70 factor (ECF subfamily)
MSFGGCDGQQGMAIAEPKARNDEAEMAMAATRDGDEAAFAALTERYRRQVHVHCYRMLGSFDDAEDVVQDAFTRAWASRRTFEGRSSFKTWLYRIATNASLDAIARKGRRVTAPDVVEASTEMPGELEPNYEIPWIGPYPDKLLDAEPMAPPDEQPDATVVSRETIELAYLAAVQHLPARQRAVLLLRDTLGWSARDLAGALEMSVASVNSALQRARATMRARLPRRRSEWPSTPDATDREREVVRRYIEATQKADTAGFIALLAADVRQTMPPAPFWLQGREPLAAMIEYFWGEGAFGDFRGVPIGANRQPAVAFYLRAHGDTVFRLLVLDVLRIVDGEVVDIDSFSGDLIAPFNLPSTLKSD